MPLNQRSFFFFQKLKISTKLLILLVLVGAVSAGTFGVLEYRAAKQSLEEESFKKLTAAREFKGQQIEDYFDTISGQVLTFSESRIAIEAMQAFSRHIVPLKWQENDDLSEDLAGFYQDDFLPRLTRNLKDQERIPEIEDLLPSDPGAKLLQQLYIIENPNPTGEKHLLDNPGDGSSYSAAHGLYHPIIRNYLQEFGYYDIFLVDIDTGIIVYSVFKEIDYGTSLLTGPYESSGIGRAFKSARDASKGDFVAVEDFAPYLPSYNAPAGFVASPIVLGNRKLGVAIFQMPIDRINDIMTNQQAWKDVGLGESGETYIVGDDLLMRNQSRFLIEDRDGYLGMIKSIGVDPGTVQSIAALNSSIGLQVVDTQGTRAALSGQTNTEIFPDYRGVPVLSAYRPLDLPGLNWVIMSEIDAAEAFAPVQRLKTTMLELLAIFISVIAVLSFLFARTLTRPINDLTLKAQQLAEGDLGIHIDTSGGDEIAQLAKSFDSMREALREMVEGLEQKVADRTKSLADSETRIRSILSNAADGIIVIDGNGIVQVFNPSAEQMFGYGANEVVGGKVDILMPERMARDHDAHLERYHKTGEKRVIGHTREVVGQTKDGTEFPMELHVGEAILGDDKIFVGIVRDITERKAQEKKIADNLSFISALVEAVPNPIFVKDTSGKYANFNAAYEQAFGVRREDIIGKTVLELDFFPEEYRKARHEEDLNLLRNGGSNHREMEVVLGDGQKHNMLFWAKAFELSEGDRGGVLGVFVDISHQKELERQLSIANKRMGDELNIGRQIQMSMIPLTFPRFPEHKDLDVWAQIRPAREVGGDFYDFFMIDDRYFAFVIADVSGKGVPAALLMAVTKTLIKARSQDTRMTSNIIEGTNNELSENNEDCMFITAFFGIIDTKTGVLTYTNAGHNPPFLIKANGTSEVLAGIHGPMIGAMEGIQYEQTEVQLDVDDKLLLYTDGVTEAFNSNGEAYGEDRLEVFVRTHGQLGTKYLITKLAHEVDEFAGDEEQSDDITIFCMRYVAWEVRDERATIELHLENKLSEINRCLQALEEMCERFKLPQEVQNNFSIVLDDLLNNVISYAFGDDETHSIDVILSTDGQRFIVSVTDEGVEFDPFLRLDPDTDSDIEDRMIGGLGIHLIRNLMDDYSYRRVNGKNVTTLMMRLQK